jgi:hypothetical protein
VTMVQDGPFPTPPTIQQDQVEVAVEGRLSLGESHRGTFKLIIHPQESSATSTNERQGQGIGMILTLLIQLLLLSLTRKTLDTVDS